MAKKLFPHYHQQESADCGPACLRMIAKYYGRQYSLEMLREHSFISREGVSMLGISDAAEYLGMHTLGVKVPNTSPIATRLLMTLHISMLRLV